MNERDLEARLRDIYRVAAERADPGALTERVRSIPATVEPERRRWWHSLRPGAARRTGLGGTHVRRGDNMFTAARVAAVVAALALGASFLAMQVGDPADEGSSAADPNAHGSIWLERHDDGLSTFYVFHGDGIVTGFHPELGIGVGLWQATGANALTATIDFTGTDITYTQLVPGTAEFRFDGQLNDAGDSMTLTYDANAIDLSTTIAERLEMAPMPPEAGVETPPDAGWQPQVGITSHGADESGITIERYGGRPNYNLEHSDGTWVSINSWVGPGVGHMAMPDEYHGIATVWYVHDNPDYTDPLVGMVTTDPETGEETNAYGTSDGFTDSAPMEPQEVLDPATDSQPLVEPDPSWWPALGSLWLEAYDDGPAVITAIHADGTLLTIDPYRGVGVGSWQPTAMDRAAVVIDYYDTDPALDSVVRGDTTLRGELQFDPSGDTATVDYRIEGKPAIGDPVEETGSMSMERVDP